MKLHSIMLEPRRCWLVGPAFAADYLGGLVKSTDIGGKMVRPTPTA